MNQADERFVSETRNVTLRDAKIAREVRLLHRDHPERVILPWLDSAGRMVGFKGSSVDHGAGKTLADLLLSDGWLAFHPTPMVRAGIGTVNAYAWTDKARRVFNA